MLLLKKAQEENEKDEDSGLCIPEEITRREDQIAKILQAKHIIEERAKERYENKKVEYDRKIKKRKLKEKKTGKKTRRRIPQEPREEPNDKKELIKTVDSIPNEVGIPENGCADTSYLSETNIDELIVRG